MVRGRGEEKKGGKRRGEGLVGMEGALYYRTVLNNDLYSKRLPRTRLSTVIRAGDDGGPNGCQSGVANDDTMYER